MASVTEEPRLEEILPKVELIETDGEPLETLWHFAAISLLLDSIHSHFGGRNDYFAAGNMFLYFSEEQARNRDYRGPDFFFVDEVDGRRERKWWAVWEEGGRYPDVIIELLSPTTAHIDRTIKKRLYERTFRTPEYYCYDPDAEAFEGWRLGPKGRYAAIRADQQDRLWCEQWQLSLGTWKGTYRKVDGVFPRFFDPQGELIPTEAERARIRAAAETQRADAEAQRANAEAKRADAETNRAERAATELAQIKARLAELERRKSV